MVLFLLLAAFQARETIAIVVITPCAPYEFEPFFIVLPTSYFIQIQIGSSPKKSAKPLKACSVLFWSAHIRAHASAR